jgi:citrate lyase subunit beta-like protein
LLQAIHPAQIDTIHSTFAPAEQAIRQAARVKFSFERNDGLGKGSYSLDGKMIDAPVYKQVRHLNQRK